MSESLFVASTPLVEKMTICLHNDRLWGIYNLTGVFKGLIIWKISSGDEIIVTQPRFETFILGWNIIFLQYNRNFSFIPGLKQKISFIQKIIFIKTKIFKFSSGDETSHAIVKILSRDEKSPYNLPLTWSPITMKSAA